MTTPGYTESDRQAAYRAGWDDVRAALASQPEPLDVERLARALAIAEVNCWANPLSGHKITDVDEDRAHREDAASIAAEYARLSEEPR